MSTADWIQASAALVAAIGVPAAITYAARQANAVHKQLQLQTEEQVRSTNAQHAALDMRLLERMLDIDRFFIEHPDLRGFIHGGWEIPETQPLRGQVEGCAEMIIDFADLVASAGRHGQISTTDYESWADFLQWYYSQSPVIRKLWRQFGAMYPPGTRELLVPATLRGASAEEDGHGVDRRM